MTSCQTQNTTLLQAQDNHQNRRCSGNENDQMICCEIDLPDTSICGYVSSGTKIFGGNLSAIDEYPWMVALEYEDCKRL